MKDKMALALLALALPALADDNLKPRDMTPVTWLEAPRHGPVEIVREGRPVAVVYVADPEGRRDWTPKRRGEEPSTLKRLVDELDEVIRLGTGASLEFVTNPPSARQPAIVIGDCEESRKAGIDAAQLPAEGFVVKTAPNRVYLVGSTQAVAVAGANDGTAWAVADFQERFAGVRWYWPAEYGGRSVPHHASLVIPPVHYSDQPVCRFRAMYSDGHALQARSFDRQLLPVAPGVLPEGTDAISIRSQLPLWRYGNSWPYPVQHQGARSYEWAGAAKKAGCEEKLFAVNADGSRNFGLLCYSAPETLALLVEDCERVWDRDKEKEGVSEQAPVGRGGAAVKRTPGPRLYGITPTGLTIWAPIDGSGASQGTDCHCPACLEALAKGGEERVMGLFLKRFGEAVKPRWPDKTVTFVPWNMKCPENVEFPDNVVVIYLQMPSLGLMHQPALRGEYEAKIRAWNAKTGRPVTLWNSFQSPSDWTYGPAQFPHVVQDFYLKNRGRLAGEFALTYGAACWVTAAPTCYVLGRSMWNPELDVDATLDEMCGRLFGPGATTARELLQLECDRWERMALTHPLGNDEGRIPARLFREIWPADVVARMKALHDKTLTKIEQAGDKNARQAFLYWTWTFDAFLRDSEAIQEVMAPATDTAVVPELTTNDDAQARFRGGSAEVNAARIANVRRVDGAGAGKSDVQFDLSWGNTWRAKWIEPAERNVTGKDLPVESWSAAWVFAKYRLPGQENEGYSHVTLSAKAADHVLPAGAVLDVGLTDGKGMGAFIYRAAPGHGPLDLADIKLRWLHGEDGVTNPAVAEVKLYALDMVYVPQGAFALGSGPGGKETGRFHEGGSGPREFVVTATWNGPGSDQPETDARRIGNKTGQLWGASKEGLNSMGPKGRLADGFPTGYNAFYCMRYEVTKGQFTEFLNAISEAGYKSTTFGDYGHNIAYYTAVGRYSLFGAWPNLKAARPYEACHLMAWWDAAKFAAWAGLRPMTELEYEKASRGPLQPVPNEYAWGTARIANAEYTVANDGKADERIAASYSTTAGNANFDATMPYIRGGGRLVGINAVPGSPLRAGIFATPESRRIAAGASYWGILELSGNVQEQVVTAGHARGRAFEGSHGSGALDCPQDWPDANLCPARGAATGRNDAIGSGLRGGCFNDLHVALRTSDRSLAAFADKSFDRSSQNGWRGARTAPSAMKPTPVRFDLRFPLLDRPVRADGVLGEWGNRPMVILAGPGDVFPVGFRLYPVDGRPSWQGPGDMGAKVYWGWDGEALCLAAEVTDDTHFNTQTGGTIWNGDAWQMGLVNPDGAYWSLILALTTNGAAFNVWCDAQSRTFFGMSSTAASRQWDGKGDTLKKSAAYAVVRDEKVKTTRYELRLPLADLGLKPGAEFGFNFCFFDDDDGTGFRYWLQLAKGLAGRTAYMLPADKMYPRFVLEE
jgi:hypothetical protein